MNAILYFLQLEHLSYYLLSINAWEMKSMAPKSMTTGLETRAGRYWLNGIDRLITLTAVTGEVMGGTAT